MRIRWNLLCANVVLDRIEGIEVEGYDDASTIGRSSMRKYYPLISVAIAAVMLLLPFGVISLNRPARAVTKETHFVDAIAQFETRFGEQSRRLSKRLDELETQNEELRRSVAEVAEAAKRAPPKAVIATKPTSPPQPRNTDPEPAPATSLPPTATAVRRAEPGRLAFGDLFKGLLTHMATKVPDDKAVALNQETSQDSRNARTPPPPTAKPAAAETPNKEAKPLPATTKKPTTQKPATKKRTKKSPSRNSKTPREKRVVDTQATVAADPEWMNGLEGIDDLGRDDKLIDVSVSRPEPGNVVSRWESLIATTLEPGWPVVLVRSEVKGDAWWVQQVVARRGNVIGARVNFGNEESLSGHRFELVVLLLDSSAEAVRFRTAREFKQLPKGTRHSKIFRYVRG